MENLRQFKRVKIDLGAELMLEQKTFPITVKDVSLGGAFISSEVSLEMNEEVELRIFLTAVEHVIEVSGRVAWIKNLEGFGIAFQELKPIDVWALLKETDSGASLTF
jgi:Tfp pilus assembly protein PilZ